MPEPLLSIRDLKVEFSTRHGHVTALDGIDLDVAAGTSMVVIGGMGSLGGAILGSAIVFGTPLVISLLAQGSGSLSSGGTGFSPVVITNLVYGALVVVIVIFEPGGFAGIGRKLSGRLRRR